MNAYRSMTLAHLPFGFRLAHHACVAILGLLTIVGTASAADEQDVEICANRYVDINDFEVLPCTADSGETYGALRMLSSTTANLEVRRVEDLYCIADGLDVAFTVRGSVEVTAEQGVLADCFRQNDATCYTFAPIRFVGLTCYLRRRA
jgi:hypothetical protein